MDWNAYYFAGEPDITSLRAYDRSWRARECSTGGLILRRVLCGGIISSSNGIITCTERHVVAEIDATAILREYAAWSRRGGLPHIVPDWLAPSEEAGLAEMHAIDDAGFIAVGDDTLVPGKAVIWNLEQQATFHAARKKRRRIQRAHFTRLVNREFSK